MKEVAASSNMSAGQAVAADGRKSHEELASNYALQVALQTMKERCQQLQARLSAVEEENCQLRTEKQRQKRQESKTNTVDLGDIDKLQEQIAQLSRQKSQLTHHIYMVATENRHLWARLSLLTEANESLGTRLSKISTALSNHTNKTEQFLNDINNDLAGQSLEEISLKLISNIQQEKTEFEAAELQSFKDCDFTLSNGDSPEKQMCNLNFSEDDVDDSYEITNDLKVCKEQMLKFLQIIKNQRDILRESVKLLKEYSRGEKDCLICKKHLEMGKRMFRDEAVMTSLIERVEKDSIDQEVQNINENSRKIQECPISGCNFVCTVMEELVDHVMSHFPPIEIKDEFDQYCLEQSPSLT